jgi:DNA polymerase III subunit chi
MTEIAFYHCTRAPAAAVAPRLVAKAHGAGHRIVLLGDAALLESLDRALWADDPASFLPHGLDDAANQPILLATVAEPLNGASVLISVGAAIPGDIAGFARVLNLFDADTPAHARARDDWKALAGRDGITRSYWQQGDGGGWSRAA